MSEPFENKYKQIRISLTALKVRYDELRNRYDSILGHNQDMYHQLKLAHSALYKAGWRRLEDMSWTNEPIDDSGIEA